MAHAAGVPVHLARRAFAVPRAIDSDLSIVVDDHVKPTTDLLGELHEAMTELSTMERAIVSQWFGLYPAKQTPRWELAKKLGVSESYVSRIKESAVGKMEKVLVRKGFRPGRMRELLSARVA